MYASDSDLDSIILLGIPEYSTKKGKEDRIDNPGWVMITNSSGYAIDKMWCSKEDLSPEEEETWLRWYATMRELQQQVIDYGDMIFETLFKKIASCSGNWKGYTISNNELDYFHPRHRLDHSKTVHR
jgi:hypothetical protein